MCVSVRDYGNYIVYTAKVFVQQWRNFNEKTHNFKRNLQRGLHIQFNANANASASNFWLELYRLII